MFLDENNVVSGVGSSAIAVLLVILNIAFLAAVAWLTIKHGARYICAFAKQVKRIVRATCSLMTAPFRQARAFATAVGRLVTGSFQQLP